MNSDRVPTVRTTTLESSPSYTENRALLAQHLQTVSASWASALRYVDEEIAKVRGMPSNGFVESPTSSDSLPTSSEV